MASILFKWFFAFAFPIITADPRLHPIYVSVTEIEHNATEKTLEVSCKIFTDDFEKTLRGLYKKRVDLQDPDYREAMNALVNNYVQKHLKIAVNGKPRIMNFKGFEPLEEAILSYYQCDDIPAVNQLSMMNNILYEYKAEQMGIIHITVNGKRKSIKLQHPDSLINVNF